MKKYFEISWHNAVLGTPRSHQCVEVTFEWGYVSFVWLSKWFYLTLRHASSRTQMLWLAKKCSVLLKHLSYNLDYEYIKNKANNFYMG